MTEIKNIKLNKKGYFRTDYNDLFANIFEDGRYFCATSFDRKWCCVGIIINHNKNLSNPNPKLQVNEIYNKRSK